MFPQGGHLDTAQFTALWKSGLWQRKTLEQGFSRCQPGPAHTASLLFLGSPVGDIEAETMKETEQLLSGHCCDSFIISNNLLCVCLCVPRCTPVRVRAQSAGVGDLLLPQGLKTQTPVIRLDLWEELMSTESSHWTLFFFRLYKITGNNRLKLKNKQTQNSSSSLRWLEKHSLFRVPNNEWTAHSSENIYSDFFLSYFFSFSF